MKALSGAVAVVAFFAVTAGAHAAITSACPYAKSGYADGCATAPVNAAFLQANFSAHARQSGQTWVSSHPQPWDVAGWDYAVGYSRVPAPAFYPLVRPDLATAGGVAAGTNLPFTTAANGCVYTAAGNPLIKGGPAIICRGQLPANGTGAYAGKTVISGIDFSADAVDQAGVWDLIFWCHCLCVHCIVAAIITSPSNVYGLVSATSFMVYFLYRVCAPKSGGTSMTQENLNILGYFLGVMQVGYQIPPGGQTHSVTAVMCMVVLDYFLGVGHTWDRQATIDTVTNCRLFYVICMSIGIAGLYSLEG